MIANLLPENGGPSLVASETCRYLAADGHDVSLFAGDHGEPDRTPHDIPGVDLRIFKTTWRRWAWSPQMAAALSEASRNYDVVHIHSVFLHHTLAAANAARKASVPYVIRPHGSFDPWLRKRHRVQKWLYHEMLERRALDGAAAIHYTTKAEMTLAHEPMRIKAPGVVLSPGIDTAPFSAMPPGDLFRAAFDIGTDVRVVLFLSRLHPKKGIDVLLRAFDLARKRVGGLHLVLAGPEAPGYGKVVRQLIADAGLERDVTLTGMVHGAMKLAAFSSASVFVLPSYTENFGFALVEAMAAGVPVILSEHVNICDEILANDAGLVTLANPVAVAEAIACSIEDSQSACRRASRAKQLVATSFAWPASIARLTTFYRSLVH